MDLLAKQSELFKSLEKVIPTINPFLYWTDSYKVSHILFETEGVKETYSNFTARFAKYIKALLGDLYDDTYVVFGIQWMLLRLHVMAQKGFFERDKKEVIDEMKAVHGPYINNIKFDQFEALHDLGYLPIIVKSLPEGTIAPVGLPFFTIRNTEPEFEWLPNYLESGISTDLWKQLTIATIARAFRLISNKFALETTGTIEGTEWQNHDFSTRGQSGFESCAINGAAFLTSSCGTDNLAGLWAASAFYDARNEDGKLLAGSVPAGEHSVTTCGILVEQERAEVAGEIIDLIEAERRYAKKMMTERFPTGIFSYVSDSYDYWSFVTKVLPSLRDVVMARDGKFVVRGDSGNPVHIIAGYRVQDISGMGYNSVEAALDWNHLWLNTETEVIKYNSRYVKINPVLNDDGSLQGFNPEDIMPCEAIGTLECLWNTFGGTKNELGYRVLDSHIGMIYGDGINTARSVEILERLKERKFASTNIVFGVGSYSLNMVSRDHLGMAIKATNVIVDIDGKDVDKPIYKDPKTDSSKKSARGLLSVHKKDGQFVLNELQTRKQENVGELSVVYMNGQFHTLTNLFEIRDRIWK